MCHLGRRGARPARREKRAYREYASDEQRRPAGCIGVQDGRVVPVRVLTRSAATEQGRAWRRVRCCSFVHALDGNGFSAYQRGAYWFFQKFHTVPEMNALLNQHHFADIIVGTQDGGSYWRAICRKGPTLPVEQVEGALRREFDLPWPEGESVKRGEEAVATWHAAQAIDAKT
jgi:hypothetical protein